MSDKLNFLFDKFTKKIMDALNEASENASKGKKVILPWQQPYILQGAKNPVTKNTYKGINAMMLNMSKFESDYWLTLKNISDVGGKIKAQETKNYENVVFWKIVRYGSSAEEGDEGTAKSIPFMRYTKVWNLDQLESWDETKLKIPRDHKKHELLSDETAITESCEQAINNYSDRPIIELRKGIPAYSPTRDVVYMPPKDSFKSVSHYYGTLFHEYAHSTGHNNRLAREGITNPIKFGSHRYSIEELVAEFTAAFLCGHVGIENTTLDNSVSYIEEWSKVFSKDKKLIVSAAQQAQKAVHWILKTETQNSSVGEESDVIEEET
jgi:antirestriction protein ArdC